MRSNRFLHFLLTSIIFLIACNSSHGPAIKKLITLNIDLATKHQMIDGFGVNFTPAQWKKSDQSSVIEKLVDDLGASIFRFDCTGLANWLDPSRRGKDGT